MGVRTGFRSQQESKIFFLMNPLLIYLKCYFYRFIIEIFFKISVAHSPSTVTNSSSEIYITSYYICRWYDNVYVIFDSIKIP